MKKIMYACAILMVFLPLMACSTGLTKAEVDPWLQQVSGDRAPAINVAGKWQDANANPDTPFSWGRGYFEQHGSKITGSLGNYNVQGRVSGDTVYLAFLSAGEVYNTARLEKRKDGVLRGDYFYADDKKQENGMPMALERVEK
ncbi:MAG: hypothetical protein K9K62_06695 [Desulfobacteraceae bacterium]|nr:hypothetical protein [Desulfobacteraceae bacterium]